MMWTTTGNLTNVKNNAKFDFGVAMLPANKRRGSPTGGGNFYVFKKATPEQQAAAVKFAKWMTTPERAAQWGIDTGYVAVRPDAWETPKMQEYVKGFPVAAVARDQLQYSVAELSTHDNQRVTKALNDGIQAALTGAKKPAQAMKDAQAEATRILRTYKERSKLVIFDCDGVLIDSEPIANRVLRERLETAGLVLSLDEVMRTFVGNTRDGCIVLAGQMLGRPLPADFGKKWDAALHLALRAVKPVAGVPELLRLHEGGVLRRLERRAQAHGPRPRRAAGLMPWVTGGSSSAPRRWPTRSPRRTCSCTRRSAWARSPRIASWSRTRRPA